MATKKVIRSAVPDESALISDDSLLSKYPGNQETEPQGEERKIRPVVDSPVKKAKKPRWRKLVEVFVGDDPGSLREYLFFDIFVPAVKNTITDMVTGGIEMLFFGQDDRRTRSNITRRGGTSHINYAGIFSRSDDRDDRRPRFNSRSARNMHDFDNLVFGSRKEAEAVLSYMGEAIIDFGLVSVADFYDMANLEASFTDQKYGWTDLRGSRIERTRHGFIIVLPPTVALD